MQLVPTEVHMNSENVSCSVKKYTDDLLDWVRGRGRIVIIVHDNPDPDCLASAVALRHLFTMKVGRDAVIAFSGMIARSENVAMAKELEIMLTPLALLDLKEFQVVCMLDTQPGTGNNSLPPGARVDVIVDHHPLKELSKACRWVDVREDYGVTATILYEYLVAQDITIGTKLATALFYAIKSETQDLGRESTRPDKEAYLRLFPVANKRLLYEITHPKLSREYFLAVNTALERTRIYGSVVIINLGTILFPEIVAEMADFLLRLEGIETVLCMGQYAGEMIFSTRTLRSDLNMGDVVKRLVSGRGTAGGHGMMAGGKVDDVPADPLAVEEVGKLLTTRLLAEYGLAEQTSERLI
jgi:nanoRNase/pAp phosphatase (c-di-AMP/oligoRNAs hydrolase)